MRRPWTGSGGPVHLLHQDAGERRCQQHVILNCRHSFVLDRSGESGITRRKINRQRSISSTWARVDHVTVELPRLFHVKQAKRPSSNQVAPLFTRRPLAQRRGIRSNQVVQLIHKVIHSNIHRHIHRSTHRPHTCRGRHIGPVHGGIITH